jgi:hypothetical protein
MNIKSSSLKLIVISFPIDLVLDYDTSVLSKFTKALFTKSIIVKRGLSLGKGIAEHLSNCKSMNLKLEEKDDCHRSLLYLDIPKIEHVFWENLTKLKMSDQTKLLKHMLDNKNALLLFDCTDNSQQGLQNICNQL